MRRLLPILALLIAGFHAGLLGRRLAQPELDSAVLLRWSGAILLLAAALSLRRRGVSLLWGRQALVFWLLVLLLHAGASASTPSAAWLVVPVFALGIAFAARRGQRIALPVSRPAVAVNAIPVTRREILLQTLLSPRPPPARLSLRHA